MISNNQRKFFALGLMLVGVILISIGTFRLGQENPPNPIREAQIAVAYACGWRNGQVTTILQFKKFVPEIAFNSKHFKCEPELSIAAKYGATMFDDSP